LSKTIMKVDFLSPAKISWKGTWSGNLDGRDYETKYEVRLELGSDGVLTMNKSDAVSSETVTFKRRTTDTADSNVNRFIGGWKAVEGTGKFTSSMSSSLPLSIGHLIITASPIDCETDVNVRVSGSVYCKKSREWMNKNLDYEKLFATFRKNNPKKISWTENSQIYINGRSQSMTVRHSVELNDDDTLTLKVNDRETEVTAVFKREF